MINPDFKYVEVSIKFIGDNYQHTREVYVQRMNYEWSGINRPSLVQEVVAVVNGFQIVTVEEKKYAAQ